MTEVRSLVRQLLLEELRKLGVVPGQQEHTITVSVQNSTDLNSFALQVLDLAAKRDLKEELQSGRLKFNLAGNTANDRSVDRGSKTSDTEPTQFKKALVTEKDISRLTEDATSIIVANNVCFTPLAKDEIRRKGLKIERKPQ